MFFSFLFETNEIHLRTFKTQDLFLNFFFLKDNWKTSVQRAYMRLAMQLQMFCFIFLFKNEKRMQTNANKQARKYENV